MNIRNAKKDDAPFIAKMVMMALHIDSETDKELYQRMTEVAAMEDTLYTYHNCRIVDDGSMPVALCLSYDGTNYHKVRLYTFALFPDTGIGITEQEDETEVGEYYIDSLAVLPNYRRKGLARMLLYDAIDNGKVRNLKPTIIVDPENPNAVKLYRNIGFKFVREIFIFGKNYHKYELYDAKGFVL